MDSVNTQECVLLAWSAQDVELHDREGLVIIPVSPAGYVATRCGTKGRVVETNHYVDGYGEAYRVTLADLRCVETALIELRQPWMASYAGMEVHLFVSQVLMWDKLLSNICKTMSHSPVTIIPPSAFENPELLRPVSWDRREMNAFWACARALERKGLVGIWRSKPAGSGKYQNEMVRLLRRAGEAGVGYCLSCLTPGMLFRRTVSSEPTCKQQTKILMAGVQVGDGTHQAPLAERLYQRYGTAFRWVSMIRDSSTSGQTTEELSLIPLASHRSAYWDDADRMAMPEWKHPRIPYWLNRYCIWKVADILLKTFRTSLSRSDWIDYLYTGPYCDLRRRYERWCRYLDGVKPRVIVGNSTFHDVAYIRAWARKQSVPYILLPHGIFPSISGRFHVDGDYLGVFGPLMVKQVRDAGIAEVRRVVSCGPMQFGDKNRSLSRCELPVERRGDGAVLYLGSFSYSFFPASPGAIAREIETLRDACRSQGCRLVVREHPRGGGKGYYRPIVELLEKEHPGVVTISAEPSMAKDIASARLVVASHFDGALIDAFYSNKPVVVFISDDKHNNSPELIGETGCLVRTEEELNLSIQSSGSNDGWVQSRIKRQRDFLSAYMGHRDGVDPWIGAEELIDKALKDTEKRIS